MQAREVGLDAALFILIQVHPGPEQEWNKWYENDHFYAGGVLAPGVLSGARWHSPRRLRNVRFVAEACPFPEPYDGNHLATYYVTEPAGEQEFREWIGPQNEALAKLGRTFSDRDLIANDFFGYSRTVRGAGASDVAPHVTQVRPFKSMFATLARDTGAEPSDSIELPDRSVSLVMDWRSPLGLAPTPPLDGVAPLKLVFTFLEDEPPADEDSTAALAEAAGQAAGAEPLWASAFLPIIPGDSDFLYELF